MAKIKSGNSFSNEMFFTLEGKMMNFHFSATKENILFEIENNIPEKNSADSTAAYQGLHDALVNSALLSSADDDYIYSFAGVVNGHVVYGGFENANRIRNGDTVKLVVSRINDVFFVHGLLRINDSLLLMPPAASCGSRACARNGVKIALAFTILTCLIFFILSLFFIGEFLKTENPIAAYGKISLGFFVFCFLFYYFVFKPSLHDGKDAEAIFNAYGFPRPEDFDTSGGFAVFKDVGFGFFGTNCEQALKKHRKKYGIQGP